METGNNHQVWSGDWKWSNTRTQTYGLDDSLGKIDYYGAMTQRNEFIILVSLCFVLFLSCMFAYTRHNSFPYYAHHDEHKKVEQLFTRDFNFNHPHLLLLSTDLVRLVRGQDDGYQRVTMSGRWVSAVFASASIVLLTLLGWRAFGLLGAWCVGLLVMVCPIVGLTAHFLKEDTSLLLGFSASLLALDLWLDKPSRMRLVWLGLACGLAASGKYIGVLCLLAVIPLVISNVKKIQGTPWPRHLALLLVPAVFVFVVINWPLFSQLDSFFGGVDKGVNFAVRGRELVDLPNFRVIDRIIKLSWSMLLMAFVGIILLLKYFRRSCHTGWVLFGASILFTGILFLTSAMPIRYILLPAVILHALAGLAIAMLAEISVQNQRVGNLVRAKMVAALAAVVLFLFAAPAYQRMALDAFHHGDARASLITWANSTLNDDAVLAMSREIRLPGVNGFKPVAPDGRLERDFVTFSHSVEINPTTLEAMRQNGITHVIIRAEEWKQYRLRAQTGMKSADLTLGSTTLRPEVVWRVPDRYREKNRWLRSNLVVVQL